MKLISLNIFGGNFFEPLIKFIKGHSATTDFFCFQEVLDSSSDKVQSRGARIKILQEFRAELPDFHAYFAPEVNGFDLEGRVDFEIASGQATFVKNNFEAESLGAITVYEPEMESDGTESTPANLQYIRLNIGGRNLTIANLHGYAYPGDKLDSPGRIAQSEKIKNFLDKETGAKILCGDFNLLPETESVKMLENGMINLIKEYGIGRTRSRLSPFFYRSDFQKFADYILVSPDIKVVKFEVPDVEVSDHLPMILEFEMRG